MPLDRTPLDRSRKGVYERLRADAARWIVPEEVGDPTAVDGAVILRLLRRHRQFRVMAWFRLGEWGHASHHVRGLAWLCEQRMGAYGVDIPPNTEIDGGLYIAHPAGVAITADRIGRNVTIVGAATIGIRGPGNAPTVGDGAYIGAGARVIGAVRVGEGALVGANAVVLDDVDDGATVVGVPARRVR